MITGEYNELVNLALNNICAADGGRLNVAYNGKLGLHYLKCETCRETRGIKRVLSLAEEHQAGTSRPDHVKGNAERSTQKRAGKSPWSPEALAMGGMLAMDLGTGELLKIEVLKDLADYALKSQLDPWRGHVCLMYGKPCVTLDGYLYHAHETNVPYHMASRPLNKEERAQYQVGDGGYAWLCEITKTASGSYFSGVGIVTAEERAAASDKKPGRLQPPVVARHPWQLAQKRAEWLALYQAFPIGEPPRGECFAPGPTTKASAAG